METQQTEQISLNKNQGVGLDAHLTNLFNSFAKARLPLEADWTEFWYNYIGQYDPSMKMTSTEGDGGRSRVFFRLTPQKIRAAHSKITEALGIDIPFRLVPLNNNPDMEYDLNKIASEQSNIIKNQLREIKLRDKLDTEIIVLAIFGTAILKGIVKTKKIVEKVAENTKKVLGMNIEMWKIPFREYPRYIRSYETEYVNDIVPVSIWDYFVDENAESADKSIGEFERKYYSVKEFQERFLGDSEYNQDAVKDAIVRASIPIDDTRSRVTQGDNYVGQDEVKDTKVSVLEFWGAVPYDLIKNYLPEEDKDNIDGSILTECAVIAAGCETGANNISSLSILSVRLNPTGKRAFKVCPFIKKPGSPRGIGIAELIRDSQKIMNSLHRLILDNKILSGNAMMFIDKEKLDTRATGDLRVAPGKSFYTKGNPRDVITPLVIPDVTGGLEVTLSRLERWADEESGVPKYMQGESASYLNKTATGMSMLMGQANSYLKPTIRNIDDYWIEPIIEAFSRNNEVDGKYPKNINYPMKTVALGTDSLMSREIKFENITKFLTMAKEIGVMSFVLKDRATRIIADILDAKDIVPNEEQAQQIMQQEQESAKMQSQAKLSANIDMNLINNLADTERAQMIAKLGIIPDPQAKAKLMIEKAQNLEIETAAKAQVNESKQFDKTRGNIIEKVTDSKLSNKEKGSKENNKKEVEQNG